MDGFKADFVQYLRENNLLNKADLDKNDANINVQKYDNQLTDFLKDYKVDENELIEAKIDINEILSMDFDDIANVVVEDDDAAQGKDVVGGFFNFLINQNDVKAQVDTNGDGKFTKDEIAQFARTVASKDGDDSSFTLQDMLGSYQQMQENNFKVGDFTPANNVANFNNNQQQAQTQNPTQAPATQAPMEARPMGVATVTSASLENLKEDELNQKRAEQQEMVDANQQNAQNALAGAGASPSNQDVLDSYTAYENLVAQVNTEQNQFSQKLAEKSGQIDSKQNETHTWQMQCEKDNEACMQADIALQDAQTTYDSALEALASAQSALSSLAKPPANATPAQQSAYVSKQADLQAAVNKAQAEADAAKTEAEAKQKEYEEAVDVYNKSLAEVARCETELNTLLSELSALQQEIAAASAQNAQQLQDAASAYNNNLIANEEDRQRNFAGFSQDAQIAASNVAVIDNAIYDVQAQEA